MINKFETSTKHTPQEFTHLKRSALVQSCLQSGKSLLKHILLYSIPLIIVIRPERKKLILLLWIFAFQLVYVLIGEFLKIRKTHKNSSPQTEMHISPTPATEAATSPMELDVKRMADISKKLENNLSHLSPDLTIKKLSKKVKIPTEELSIYFNHYLNTTFKSYINTKRIEHSIQLVENNYDKYTIDYIAEESGFQNRTTYYRAFKKVTGMSPTQYYESCSFKQAE